jgi:diguanylate cyclase (GGDEF)-like protein
VVTTEHPDDTSTHGTFRAALVVGAVVVVLANAIVPDLLSTGLATSAYGLLCAGMLTRVRGRDAPGWWLFAAGLALMAISDVLWVLVDQSTQAWIRPAADTGYLLGTGCMIAGAGVLVRAGNKMRLVETILDVGIIVIAVTMVTWQLLVGPSQAPVTSTALFATMAYPPMDAALVYLFWLIARQRKVTDPATGPMLIGAAVLLATDMIYATTGGDTSNLADRISSSATGIAYLGFALGALALGTGVTPPPTTPRTGPTTPGPARLFALALALACSPVLMLLVDPDAADVAVLMAATLGIVALVVVRLFLLLHSRSEAEARLAHESTHDALTGLLNRRGFTDHFGQLPITAGLVYIDLDRFKVVNDVHGHGVGDRLLVAVAERLAATVRDGDVVARLGGDEFAVLCPNSGTGIAERIHAELSGPVEIDHVSLFVEASVGYTHGEFTAENLTELLTQADLAMYQAKRDPTSHGVVHFEPAMRDDLHQRAAIENALRDALEHRSDALSVVYQPIVDATSKDLVALEALVRLTIDDVTENTSLVIDVAESSGLVSDLGRFVQSKVTDQLARWQRLGFTGRIHVNCSSHELADPRFADTLLAAAARLAARPGSLVVEVTETALVQPGTTVVDNLTRLRDAGVGVHIDDFGTGYSSLVYLTRLPMEAIKIDRAFVDGVDANGRDALVVRSIVSLAESLDVGLIAEGVETESQRTALIALGCNHIQGYLIARPLPVDQVTDWVTGDMPTSARR